MVGLHRVLPDRDPRWAGAMEEFSVTTSAFEEVLDFLAESYTFVALDDVLAASEGRTSLPPVPALVTFDDGWSDTAEVALPILHKRGIPSVVFTVADRVGQRDSFWQTEWWAALKTNSREVVEGACRALGLTVSSPRATPGAGLFHRVIRALEDRPLAERWSALSASGLTRPDFGPSMIDDLQLRMLPRRGMSVGVHGCTHEPMTRVESIACEIVGAREMLNRLVSPDVVAPVLSFPHGRYGPKIVGTARAAGYRLLFTSDQVLTPVSALQEPAPLLGRVWAGHSLLKENGRLDRARAVRRFYLAPIQRLPDAPKPPFDT